MISLCLTNYERSDMLLESFEQVLADPRISEIVISDDCSSQEVYEKVEQVTRGKAKIKLFRNESNVGMSMNKKIAIEKASRDYCILFDSDNVITRSYIDCIYQHHRYPSVIYMPDCGGPRLDYSRFGKWYISVHNIGYFLGFPGSEMMLNTCNYFVNRRRYLDVYQYNPDIKASDTIWFNYLWLKSGGGFTVIPGMQYTHRIHPGSGFMKDVRHNEMKCAEILALIKALPNEKKPDN